MEKHGGKGKCIESNPCFHRRDRSEAAGATKTSTGTTVPSDLLAQLRTADRAFHGTESTVRLHMTPVPDSPEVLFELLAEKGILTAEEVKERIKKLKSETPLQFRWLQ